ncbi:MAG: ATP-binding cassette domain-containing protein [Pseudomonadota bacterium]|nr:ATP-binding cassette domain-containing protein [Pseudomonadota bacterium]
MSAALLRVRELTVVFGARQALRDINFELFTSETLGLVGESGSGKSTLARAILRLLRPAHGRVEFLEQDLLACTPAQMRNIRRDLQIVFQDPLASLNPRMSVGNAIAEPLIIFEPALDAVARRQRVGAMLERVGLAAVMADRYPHEFSGGQCQRIGIARAMILNPKLLICDEPVSGLDVSIQGQIVNLLLDLQRDAGMAMLFISHNLAVVRHLSHRVLVIYGGRIVEVAVSDTLFNCPLHPYTQALLTAIPALPGSESAQSPRPAAPAAAGAWPQDIAREAQIGCAFRHRCPFAVAVCTSTVPPLKQIAPGHWAACHRANEWPPKAAARWL